MAGMAFHAGVLLALHNDFGWDARDADVIVGTSAGSIIEHVAPRRGDARGLPGWTTDATPTPAGRKFRALMLHADRLGPVAPACLADDAGVDRSRHLRPTPRNCGPR